MMQLCKWQNNNKKQQTNKKRFVVTFTAVVGPETFARLTLLSEMATYSLVCEL